MFFGPLGNASPQLPRLIARLYGEPESVSQPLIESEFGETTRRFLAALGAALPDVAPDELAWRYHFMIGAMIHTLSFGGPPRLAPSSYSSADGLARLLAFSVAGVTYGIPNAFEESRG